MPDVPTPKHAIEQPADGDFINDWPAIMRAALGQLDDLIASFIEDDPRPAAGVSGRFHRAADGTISFDTGGAWVEVARMGHALRHMPGGDDPLDVDAPVGEGSLRTLGTGARQAAAGSHAAQHNEGGADPIPGQVPIGCPIPYGGNVLPPGGAWAWADGSLIDKQVGGVDTIYFTRVGHAYNGGVDPGSGKVRLPDKRGRVSVGADNFGAGAAGRLPNSNRLRGQNGGVDAVTLAASQIPAHAHPLNDPGHTHNGYCADQMDPPDGSTGKTGWAGGRFAGQWITTNGSNLSVNNNTGGGGSHSNMQPYEADNYIVRIA